MKNRVPINSDLQLSLLPGATCGYCGNKLEELGWRPGWSCPRCAPILRDLPIAAFAQFTKEAARARRP